MSSAATSQRRPFLLVPSPSSSTSSKSRSISPTSCDDNLVVKKSGSKGQRIRASKPKVKSGCITCKLRRVKCDEQKPGCNRCKKLGKECEGYVKEISPTRTAILLPLKPKPCTVNLSLTRSIMVGQSCHEQPVSSVEIPTYAGTTQHNFWSQLILQECYSDHGIRHAVSNMTKVARSRRSKQTEPMDYTMPFFTSFECSDSVVEDFEKTIVKLGRSLADATLATTQTALVACILLIAFENLCGDPDKIEEHVQGGLALLEQWQHEHPHSSTSTTTIPRHPEELILDDFSAMFWQLEDDSDVSMTSTSGVQRRPSILHQDIADDGFVIPLAFEHLDQASQYWDRLLRRLRSSDRNFISHGYHSTKLYPIPWIEDEHKAQLDLLFLFRTAVEPLVRQCQGASGFLLDTGPLILDLAAQTSQLYLSSTDTSELVWDLSSHIFADIVTKAQSIINHTHSTLTLRSSASSSHLSNTSVIRLLPVLHMTALKCRDPKIRRQAITLLFSSSQSHHIYNNNNNISNSDNNSNPSSNSTINDEDALNYQDEVGIMLATVDLWIMALEESGVNELGFIPESSRWRLVDVQCDLAQRWVWAKACRDACGDLGHWFAGVASEETRLTW